MLLIDSIERYKANTNRAIREKLEKISTLERQINALTNEIQKEKMKQLENIQSNSIKNNKNDAKILLFTSTDVDGLEILLSAASM